MTPAVQPTNALPIADRMSCLIIDYMRFPMRPVSNEVDAPNFGFVLGQNP